MSKKDNYTRYPLKIYWYDSRGIRTENVCDIVKADIVTYNGTCVASLEARGTVYPNSEMRANALVLVQAIKMLRVLQSIKKISGIGFCMVGSIYTDMENVIKNARGTAR